ncbi:MAG: ribosomal L7Ae/L30e/S12e/Gadd45 family protein [Candidatus Aenigmarchaeota archaeon]|nr:ribosomal L7Ae/L30e/S12e/Gadd45 family protein [Candidatus Aenigmarchaeota archaeon]
MEQTDRLPKGEFMIGAREIAKALKNGVIEKVFVASNCPDNLLSHVSGAEVIKFTGDQRELAARLGKPFPVAMAAMKKTV